MEITLNLESVLVKQTGYIGSGVFSDVYKGYVLRAGQSESDVKHVAIKKIWPDPSREVRTHSPTYCSYFRTKVH